MNTILIQRGIISLWLCFFFSCQEKAAGPSEALIASINLKSGDAIVCGPADQQYGTLSFDITGSKKVKEDFNLGVKMLHSFEYDEAEKVFARIIEEEPGSAMAYWGVAMANFHPLWAPPSEAELTKGAKAIDIGKSIGKQSVRERDYLEAISAFYNEWNTIDHRSRCVRFEKAMEGLTAKYPDDKEASSFYALALTAAADPTDKTFAKQKKAGDILRSLYADQPNHPGIVHYIIHAYDSPELAAEALPAARKYASIAPSSAHALHMPSHIFTRLGLWDECIHSNLASANSAQCYAEAAGIKGHWDEELHAMDYLVYAYLQKGDNVQAKKQWDYLKSINVVEPQNFKVAYAFAAIPARYLLENKLWKDAAQLQSHQPDFPWKKFAWENAIIHFTRLMGSVHSGDLAAARSELQAMNTLHDTLLARKDSYKAGQVAIQKKAGEAWILLGEGKKEAALNAMQQAADMEDKTEKHPVTPGEVLPARELLGDMLLQLNQPSEALAAYELDLKKHPNRFNGLYGAAVAAERSGNKEASSKYYKQLLAVASKTGSDRKELVEAWEKQISN